MKYEIRKRSKAEASIWYTIAWADTKEWADKILDALSICEDGDFTVFVNDCSSN